MRYHVHGTCAISEDVEAAVTVCVDADDDSQAQYYAWLVCPGLDLTEIDDPEVTDDG